MFLQNTPLWHTLLRAGGNPEIADAGIALYSSPLSAEEQGINFPSWRFPPSSPLYWEEKTALITEDGTDWNLHTHHKNKLSLSPISFFPYIYSLTIYCPLKSSTLFLCPVLSPQIYHSLLKYYVSFQASTPSVGYHFLFCETPVYTSTLKY